MFGDEESSLLKLIFLSFGLMNKSAFFRELRKSLLLSSVLYPLSNLFPVEILESVLNITLALFLSVITKFGECGSLCLFYDVLKGVSLFLPKLPGSLIE